MKTPRPAVQANPAPAPRKEKAQKDPPESGGASSGLRTQALNDEVTRVARDLWKRYGCPEGRDEAIRREAERQVLGADPEVARVAGGSVSAPDLREATSAAVDRNAATNKPASES